VDPNPAYQRPADADGYSWYYTVTISETAGKSATITGFSIDDTDYSAYINTWFGTATLPAHGKLSVGLRTNVDTVPASKVFRFTGVDATGSKWSQEVTVQFLGKAPSASMVLTSIPEVVKAKAEETTGCPQGYPFYQVLSLKERYGYAVSLSKFLAGANDFSDAIENWFGSSQLPATGELQTVICWTLDGPFPETLDYEVDGTDSGGTKVSAKLSVQFQTGPDLNQPSGGARLDRQPATEKAGRRPARAWILRPGEFGR